MGRAQGMDHGNLGLQLVRPLGWSLGWNHSHALVAPTTHQPVANSASHMSRLSHSCVPTLSPSVERAVKGSIGEYQVVTGEQTASWQSGGCS